MAKIYDRMEVRVLAAMAGLAGLDRMVGASHRMIVGRIGMTKFEADSDQKAPRPSPGVFGGPVGGFKADPLAERAG